MTTQDKVSGLVYAAETLRWHAKKLRDQGDLESLADGCDHARFLIDLQIHKLIKIRPWAICECGRVCGTKRSYQCHKACCKYDAEKHAAMYP